MNLNRLAYFAAVVDAGSFTRAAERLGITKAVVSRRWRGWSAMSERRC